jgi:molybdopterin synthase sulfur carrier subunit
LKNIKSIEIANKKVTEGLLLSLFHKEVKLLIKVEVRLFAYFREGREKKQVMEVEDGTTISDIVKALDIDEEEVSIFLLNGIDGPSNRQVKDGDIIALFPPVGGG